MNDVLVDTSVWISFFRNHEEEKQIADALDYLLAGDEAIVNDVILAELLPSIIARRETELEELFCALRKPQLETDWKEIIDLQVQCLRAGINKVGLPDLIIAQQAISLDVPLFSMDRHFSLISKIVPLRLWPGKQT